MDFMEGGSLTDTLGTTVDFKEMYIAYVCREILLALAFMHHQFRLHRDIKSDNVLVRTRRAPFPHAVILSVLFRESVAKADGVHELGGFIILLPRGTRVLRMQFDLETRTVRAERIAWCIFLDACFSQVRDFYVAFAVATGYVR